MSEKSNIAIIVPVLDDTPALHSLIDRIHSWSEQPKEIIVVSANSDLELSAFCETHGCRYLESKPCRGTQLDSGARNSEAPVLWFLHADAVPYPSSLRDIALALAEGSEAGHFSFKFAGPSTWHKVTRHKVLGTRSLFN